MPTRRLPLLASLLLALLLVLPLAACGPRVAPGATGGPAPSGSSQLGRGILVIAVDGLRRDRLSLYGYERATSTALEAFAEGAIVFENAFTPASEPEPAHVALLTGCDPTLADAPAIPLSDGISHARPALPWRIPQRVPRLALELLTAQWATGAFVDRSELNAAAGFALGFHDWLDAGRPWEAGAEVVSARLVDWLGEHDRGRNWFAYVQLSDLERCWKSDEPLLFPLRPELEYGLPLSERKGGLFTIGPGMHDGQPLTHAELDARYDSAISRLDAAIGGLLATVLDPEQAQRTSVVVVGSHGLALGEDGLWFGGGGLSAGELRVPLLIRPAPDLEFDVGRRESALVSTMDLAPTLLELAGCETPHGMHGRSLTALLRGREGEVRAYVFARTTLFEGTAATDGVHLLQRLHPARRPALARAWYGSNVERTREEVRLWSLAGPEPWAESLDDPARARLQAEADAWNVDAELARKALHLGRWDASARDPAVLRMLERKGILPDPE